MNKFFKLAKKIASAESEMHKTYRLGAICVKGRKIIGTGINKYKTSPKIKELSTYHSSWDRTWMHAELDAINRLPEEQINNSVVYVVRVSSTGSLANAHPCEICRMELKKLGVKKIVYSITSDDDEEYGTVILK